MKSTSSPRPRFKMTTFAFIMFGSAAAGLAACGAEGDPMGGGEGMGMGMGMTTPPAAGVSCPTRGALVTPSMPSAVTPPGGSELFLRTHAEGTQKYTCQASARGGYAWAFTGPEAKLYDDRCVLVGTHFGGPTWKLDGDGSAVVGRKLGEAPASAAGAIPWLLLEKTSVSGTGMMSAVTYINRIDTVAGTAPTEVCDAGTAGREIAVPYTATYLYYRAGAQQGAAPAYPY